MKKSILFFILTLCFLSCGNTNCNTENCYDYDKDGNAIWSEIKAKENYKNSKLFNVDDSELDQSGSSYSDDGLNNRTDTTQAKLLLSDPQSADIFKRTPGYSNFRGILISGFKSEDDDWNKAWDNDDYQQYGIILKGLVKVYGGVYTTASISMEENSIIIGDSDLIRDIKTMTLTQRDYNGNKCETVNLLKEPVRPFNLKDMPVKITLLNPHEQEIVIKDMDENDNWWKTGMLQ